ncbi:MAG: alanine--tRNA ligase [Deltaproteobacteria bacterium]|nr:alanine--tRNA ligase [Deltaproteobacteria bacterium]
MNSSETTGFGIPFQSSRDIRETFLKFFMDRQHTLIPSAGIAPSDDPTLLFTNSGMNQFKSIFLGDNRAGLKRATNSQKCLRVSGKHNDLDEVGRDGTHHTFFEMLGNWSFGDYYKKEAILWAWELLTKVWKFPRNRLFATVYKDDEETALIWKTVTDIDHERILFFEKENFWEMGTVGPCGPCSEIHFDLGDLKTQAETFCDPVLGVNGQNQRYIEIWNLVFMQFERMKDGSLSPLKETHVDTGSGFERLCMVIQGQQSNYDSDVFRPLISKIAELSQRPYSGSEEGVPHRVIADHVRALGFAIADGVTPGNEGRGYVMRRILRRACRFAHQLGQKEPFLCQLIPVLVGQMGDIYPELKEQEDYIIQVVRSEESRFLKTLDQGLSKLSVLIDKLKQSRKDEISGQDAFLFHDTYGFPVDLVEVIAREHGLGLDLASYQLCMEEQKDRARKAKKFDDTFASDESWVILSPSKETRFTGYHSIEETSVSVLRYREAGDEILLVTECSPFYAEAGGQVGDQGLVTSSGLQLRVLDTRSVLDLHVHRCSLIHGLVSEETLRTVDLLVDQEAREKTRRNHSATHLLHSALRQVLGEHVSQQGSWVGPERLRFDFRHHQALTEKELLQVECLVNQVIRENQTIETSLLSFDKAREQGAMALFGEKYGDTVRVLTMGSFSKELCGGTHADATGDIGLFRIVSESSVAAGVRRIEACAGLNALIFMQQDRACLHKMTMTLKCSTEHLGEKVAELAARSREAERSLQNYHRKEIFQKASALCQQYRSPSGSGYKTIGAVPEGMFRTEDLQILSDSLSSFILADEVIFLTVNSGSQLSLLLSCGSSVRDKVRAGELISKLAPVAEARGGGRADRARAGSGNPAKEALVLEAAEQKITNLLAESKG